MSRIAKAPINISANIVVQINDNIISIKGKKGELTRTINEAVDIKYINNQLIFTPRQGYANGWALAGTTRALLNSMVIGVTDGFTKKIHLVGIGYRAIVTGNVITLFLGFSHSIKHKLPEGITAECASQTEILLKGSDKQIIGQVAAELCSYRRPDPYKGKGIRYADAILYTKETKKK